MINLLDFFGPFRLILQCRIIVELKEVFDMPSRYFIRNHLFNELGELLLTD